MIKMNQVKPARDAIVMNSRVVFYRGVRAPEISRTIEDFRVPESTVYEGLQLKKTCIRAFLEDRDAIWLRRFQTEITARYEATGGGLEIIADVLREWFEDSRLRSSISKVIASNPEGNGQESRSCRSGEEPDATICPTARRE